MQSQLDISWNSAPQTYRHRSIGPALLGEDYTAVGADLLVKMDAAGEIVEAHYESGAQVARFQDYVIARSSDRSLWFCDQQGRWFCLD